MFRASTIIRALALKLAKVIFILKYSVKLRPYCTEYFNTSINITVARFSASSLMMVEDRNM